MTPRDIQAEYDRLGYKAGWSFMYGPEARMRDANVAFVGLNPAGPEDSGRNWDFPANAYHHQKWAAGGMAWSPLQHQVDALFRALQVSPDQVFAAQFVPFRSPDLARLGHQAEAFAFGRQLWTWVLERTPATLFLCLGRDVTREVVALTGAKADGTWPTGWGRQTFKRYVAPGKVIVGLPHLSRFQVFGRQNGGAEDIVERLREAARAPVFG